MTTACCWSGSEGAGAPSPRGAAGALAADEARRRCEGRGARPRGESKSAWICCASGCWRLPSQSLKTHVRGMESTAPATPQMLPQKVRATTIVSGWRSRPWDMIHGSMIWPGTLCTRNCTTTTDRVWRIVLSGSSQTIGTGRRMAAKEPRFGTKFRKKVRTPKKRTNGTRIICSATITSAAISRLAAVLRMRYCCTKPCTTSFGCLPLSCMPGNMASRQKR
mmetsp:Transcript_41759/g.130005  ORF Transcript_41759/g.130005 Transcript_41759/m.130005 type:complete len:221 (+) Transcript_41759:977-1639(+)